MNTWILIIFIWFASNAQNKLLAQENEKLTRESLAVESVVNQFEVLHDKNDFVGIKSLISSKISRFFDPIAIAAELAPDSGRLEDGHGAPIIRIKSVEIRRGKKGVRALVKGTIVTNGKEQLRTYFLNQEMGEWKLELVLPCKLDRFFFGALAPLRSVESD